MRHILLLVMLFGVLAWVPASAAVINVPGDQPSIQTAVAAASNGDTIAVDEGTYIESGQIVISKNITITGAGSDLTTIMKSDDTGTVGDSRGWFLVSPGRSVTIRDMTLDGGGVDICEAIRSRGTVTVTGCAFKNIMSPNYEGTGVVLLVSGTVNNCTFSDMGRAGVLAWGTTCSNAIVSNNVYFGKGTGDQLDCGVEVDEGARATISNNSISDCKGVTGYGATSAGVRVMSTPSGSSSATLQYNTITRCAVGVAAGADISDTSTVVATYNHIAGNVLGVKYAGREQSRMNFKSNWWGSSSGPGPSGSGQGDRIRGTILWAPYLLMPNADNSLYLEASWNGGIYVKPGQNSIVWMRVSRLRQMVVGCQAMLGYDSTYFSTGSVAAGGGDWDDLIYQSWAIPGEIDTAIGVKGSSTAGTQADATVAVVALTAKNVEGITQLVFRPDADSDPGLVESTIFSDMTGNPVWPGKVSSTNIYIDGTPPVVSAVSARQGAQELIGTGVNAVQGTVNIRVSASDALSGIGTATGTAPVVTVTPNSGSAQTAAFIGESPTGTYNYSWTIGPDTPNGPAVIRAVVSDRSGNSAVETRVISIGWPYSGNVLYLHNLKTYVQPNSTVSVQMKVTQLQQVVMGCQAMLGYDSTYFDIGSVAAGGGDWDEMIYQSWSVPGEIDTAVGVKGNSASGTQADGTVAVVALAVKDVEGITQLVFRPDASPDPGLVKSTFFSDVTGNPVWPGKVNSTSIYIDGTPPVISTVSARQGAQELIGTGTSATYGTVNIRVNASDMLSGIGTAPVVTVTPNSGSAQTAAFIGESPTGTYNYSWTVGPDTPNGPAVIAATVSDRSGNPANAVEQTIDVLRTTDNLLYMEAPGGGNIYTRPYSSVQIGMKVANLRQRVIGCQAMLGYNSTYLNIGNVVAGGGDWDEMIYQSWSVLGEIDTAIGVKGSSTTGTQANGTVAVLTLSAKSIEGITQLVFRPDADPDPGLIKSTFFSDMTGSPVWPAKINSTNIYIDGTVPVLSTLSAKQGTQELIGTGVNALQGTVNIRVSASDALSGIGSPPVVTVTPSSGSAQTATFTGEGPAGTYNYTWNVNLATPNGVAVIRATAYDRSGNSTSLNRNIRVNINTISGQIELDRFVGASRNITFVANGSVRKVWSVPVTGFSGGVASFTLVDVPDGETSLSAATSWNLRRKLTLTGGLNGQWTANFTGTNKLLGGDLDGSNCVNLLDYSILKANWFTGNAVADIDGDQMVNTSDYSIIRSNWFIVGDPE